MKWEMIYLLTWYWLRQWNEFSSYWMGSQCDNQFFFLCSINFKTNILVSKVPIFSTIKIYSCNFLCLLTLIWGWILAPAMKNRPPRIQASLVRKTFSCGEDQMVYHQIHRPGNTFQHSKWIPYQWCVSVWVCLWGGFCRQKYFQRRVLINDAWTAPLVTILGKLVISQLYLTKNHLDATNGMLVYVNFNYSCWVQLASLQMITHRWHLANVTNAGIFCSTLMVAYKAGATASGYFLVCVVQVFRSQCKIAYKIHS